MRKSVLRSLGILVLGLIQAVFGQDLSQIEGSATGKPEQEDLRNLSLLVRGMMPETLSPAARVLNSAVNKAFKAGDDTATWRLLTRMLLTLQGERWDEGLEMLSSYRLTVNRRLAAPGEGVVVALDPLFRLSRPLGRAYTVRLALVDGRGKAVGKERREEVTEFAPLRHEFATKGLKDGEYEAVYELLGPDGTRVAEVRRPVTVNRRLDQRLEKLEMDLERARGRMDGPRAKAAVETAEYLYGLMRKARGEYVAAARQRAHPLSARIAGLESMGRYSGEPFRLETDLPLAERLVGAVAAGNDPFAGLKGDLRLAYRSEVDGSLQPYRVYVPAKGARRVLVTLHGVSGDENTYFGAFTGGLLEKLAEERGYLVASPNGRGPAGGYVGASRRDVYDVRERAVELFGMAGAPVFLTGHSMGAMGAWQIAFEKPELWAGVAPVAGAMGVTRRMFERSPEMPVFLAQGAKDRLTIAPVARNVAKPAREVLKVFEYREYPEADHFTIGVASLADVFDFFDRIQVQGGSR